MKLNTLFRTKPQSLGQKIGFLLHRWKKHSHYLSHKHRHFRTILIAGGVVFVWRGLWGLMDILLLPTLPTTSMMVSIVIGVVVLLIDDFEINELR